ncbi:hypothetical protein [Streptomyces clavifer]|uniref:hypothetical protein n=1 Tax=Streptomyces clavifer TaxID=68188 RepID=UPI003685D65F
MSVRLRRRLPGHDDLTYLPGPSDDVLPYEPWAGEPEVLTEAAAVWIRSLPAPPSPSPVGTWLAVTLPDVVEAATASLDPAQCSSRTRRAVP